MAKIPRAISSSEIKLGDFIMHVHVLDNGQRVIDAEDMEAFFNQSQELTSEQATELAKALRG
jgi:hypothetical protein